MTPRAERRLMTGVLMLCVVALILMLTRDSARPDGWGGLPFPRHVEWTQYTVSGEGWMLCRPSCPADSTENPAVCLPLPLGVQVYVPRWVEGADEDEARGERGRKTSR